MRKEHRARWAHGLALPGHNTIAYAESLAFEMYCLIATTRERGPFQKTGSALAQLQIGSAWMSLLI